VRRFTSNLLPGGREGGGPDDATACRARVADGDVSCWRGSRIRQHVGRSLDEFWRIVGLVTAQRRDERQSWGISSTLDERLQPSAQRRRGRHLADRRMFEMAKLEAILPASASPDPDNQEYQTSPCFVVKQLGHVPKEARLSRAQGYVFEILDMDHYRVDKVFVMPARPARSFSIAFVSRLLTVPATLISNLCQVPLRAGCVSPS